MHWCPQQHLRRNVQHAIQPPVVAETDQIWYGDIRLKYKINVSISSGQIVKSDKEERFPLPSPPPFLFNLPLLSSLSPPLTLEVDPLNPTRGVWWSAVSSPSTAGNNCNNFPQNQLTKFRAFYQRCSPRDQGLGLEAHRGQK